MKMLLLIPMMGLLVAAQEKPSFQIVAPNILCSRTTPARSPQLFTIRLEPASDQKLNYHVKVTYEYSTPQMNQRHTLRVWQTVRQLETHFGRNRVSINAENQIDIATSMLTPGVIYTFEIVAEDEEGRMSERQRYSLDYKEGDLYRMCQENDQAGEFSMEEIVENIAAKDHPWIRIVGPKETYANLPLILEAKVHFLGNENEYFLNWTIFGHKSPLLESIRGSLVSLPPHELEPGREYTFEAQLVDAGNSEPVARVNHSLTVKFHPLIVDLEPQEVLAGPGRLLDFEVHIQDMNRRNTEASVEWRCVAQQSETLCNEFPPPHGQKISLGFVRPGKYQLQAIVVTRDNLTDMETCLIEIQPDIVARTKVVTLPQHPADVTQWVRGQVQIDYVVAKCVAKWGIVEQEGYAYTDLSVLGGNIGEIVVNDFEGTFLAELADFSNATVSKLVNLRIPPAHFYPHWEGLMPDAKYKLRLTIECPEPHNPDVTPTSATPRTTRSFMDIDLDTNSPPKLTALTVDPKEGPALSQPFKFKAVEAHDKDGPLLFTYGFEVLNHSVILRRGFDLASIETVLPSGTVTPFCKVCDVFNACLTVQGPILNVQASTVTFEEVRKELDWVESAMDRMEFSSSINAIFIYGVTLRNGDEKLFKEFQTNIVQLIRAQTKRILEFPDMLSNDRKLDYIQSVKRILEVLEIRNNEIVRDLMRLVEVIVDDEGIQIARDIKRRKRQTAETAQDPNRKELVTNLYGNLLNFLTYDQESANDEARFNCLKNPLNETRRHNFSVTAFRSDTLNGTFEFTSGPVIHLNNASDPVLEYCVGLLYDMQSVNSGMFRVLIFSRDREKKNFYAPATVETIGIEFATHEPSKCITLAHLDPTRWEPCPSSQNQTTLHCTCGGSYPFRIQADEPIPTPAATTTLPASTNAITDAPTTTTSVLHSTQSDNNAEITTLSTTESTTGHTTAAVADRTVEVTTVVAADKAGAHGGNESVVIAGQNGAVIETQDQPKWSAAIGYSALAVVGIGAALGVVSFYLYRQNQKKNNSFALDLQAIAAEARAQIPGIRYSRFHDENTMRGDSNVYTMG